MFTFQFLDDEIHNYVSFLGKERRKNPKYFAPWFLIYKDIGSIMYFRNF